MGGWSSSGSGSFSSTQSNGTVIYYTPSPEDLELGYVNITTNFGGECFSLGEYTKTLFFGIPKVTLSARDLNCWETHSIYYYLKPYTFNDFSNIEILEQGDGLFTGVGQNYEGTTLVYDVGPNDEINGFVTLKIVVRNPLTPDCPGDTAEITFELASPGHISVYSVECVKPPVLKEVKPTDCSSSFGLESNLSYQWYKSTTGCGNWELIPGATGLNYSPGFKSQKTCYIRRAYCSVFFGFYDIFGNPEYDTCSVVSNCVCVEPCVNDEPVPDTIKGWDAGIGKLSKNNGFGLSLSPNPASNNIRIQFNNPSLQNFEVNIYNLLGEKIIDVENSNNSLLFDKTIDLSSIVKGIYMVNIQFWMAA
ncbi:MAG: T9SS type A sorting domain-containing protein [Bacteroidetes bacterium]|nr:T9SS type A sorting domain-containing protein [Bacteroidota bacterium]